MSKRFAPHAVFTIALALFLSPLCRAQEEPRRPAGEQVRNPTAGAGQNRSAAQDRNQAAPGVETIRGVISGITAEGEIMLDYRTNAAARTEGAYLTIVGSPIKSDAGNRDRQVSGAESRKPGWSGERRHNVYIAWLFYGRRSSILVANSASPTRIGGRLMIAEEEPGTSQGGRVRPTPSWRSCRFPSLAPQEDSGVNNCT